MKVCFETFGCRLNRAEALQMEADYVANGWEVTTKHSDAQLIVVRGCSVTQRAQHECEKTIAHLQKKYPATRILTVGCFKDKKNAPIISSARNSVASALTQIPETTDSVPTRTARAYLKVQDGCNSACTFCIVPTFRGKSVSVPFSQIIARAEKFIASGYQEIVVTGCNLSQYLSDGKRLDDLIASLASLSRDCRIRIGSLEPSPVASNVVDVIASNENCCRFLHIPVQSGSDKILSAMRRPYRVRDIDALATKAAHAMPDIGLGCDIIAGFPEESEIDFIATKGLLSRLPFTKAHVFPYSVRPGTVAATLPNQIASEVRRERAHEIANMMDERRSRYIQRFKNREVKVVIEDEKTLSGWTSEYIWCQIDSPIANNKNVATQLRKKCVTVRVNKVENHILKGKMI